MAPYPERMSRAFALDIYDWVHVFGHHPVNFVEWWPRFAAGRSFGTANRRWDRTKQRLHFYGVPHRLERHAADNVNTSHDAPGWCVMRIHVRLLPGAREMALDHLPSTELSTEDLLRGLERLEACA